MKIDSLLKNIQAYILFAVLSLLAAVLIDVHRQIVSGGPFNYWMMLDAALVALVPIITNTTLNMKLPSVGNEPIAAKVEEHQDNLEVVDPEGPPPAWLPNTNRETRHDP
jgi:hypothetical protein